MRRNENKKRNNKGFSLVELIIVIAIMAILIGVLTPQFVKYLDRSKVATDLQNAQQIASAISAQCAEDATTGTAVLPTTITNMDVTTKGDANSDTEKVQKVIGGNPAVKVDSSYKFFVTVDSDGNVKVTAGAKADSADEIYPTVVGTKWGGPGKAAEDNK